MTEFSNWSFVQSKSNEILGSGLSTILEGEVYNSASTFPITTGNYLISNKQIHYVGEAQNLDKRLKQQFSARSTFYKNYLKTTTNAVSIDFVIRLIETRLGRKEFEEFTIVNLPADLNRFQRNKRSEVILETNKSFWSKTQGNTDELLLSGAVAFSNVLYTSWIGSTPKSEAGIYSIEHKTHGLIYIGESSGLRDRWKTHSSKTYFSALRRNIGRTLFDFELQTIKNKKKYFSSVEDDKINQFLSDCRYKCMPVKFGRIELEEFLIKNHQPLLNRKGN